MVTGFENRSPGTSSPGVRLFVRGTKALARVLGVTPKAVRQAVQAGRIHGRGDPWDVLEAVQAWRASTEWSAHRQVPRWLRADVPLTPTLVSVLARRVQQEGGVVEGRSQPDDDSDLPALLLDFDLNVFGDADLNHRLNAH